MQTAPSTLLSPPAIFSGIATVFETIIVGGGYIYFKLILLSLIHHCQDAPPLLQAGQIIHVLDCPGGW